MKKYFTLLILTFLIGLQASAQTISVKGNVKDEQGTPVVGASVFIKETMKGTATDIDGNFRIDAKKGDLLVIQSIGFQKAEIEVTSPTVLAVLKVESTKIDEVVVIGYGAVKKSDLTGSVSSVKVESIQSIPTNSVTSLLQGRSAGLQVINSSQDPGASPTIRIRGGSSLKGSNSPLVVVDGFPLGDGADLKQINSADVESIEVLKDASAAAIYGSRGANGVIMVTTRKAKEGITHVQINQQTTISQFDSKLDLWRNPVLMAQISNESRVNGKLPALYIGATNSNGVYYPSIEEIQTGKWAYNTRWDDVVFRDAPVSNNTSVAINSANATTSYNLSANFFDDKGIYIEDEYMKGSVKLGVDHKVFKNLTIRTNNIISKDYRNNNAGLAYYRNPLWPVYNEDGSYFLAGKTDFDHPMALTDNRTNKYNGIDIISSWMLDWDIIEGLNLKSQANYKYGSTVSDVYNPKDYTEEGNFNNGAAHLGNWLGQNIVSETYMTYNKHIGEENLFTAMLGYSYEHTMDRSSNLSSYNFVNESTGNENMGSGDPEKNIHSNSMVKTTLVSYLGRVNFSMQDKYLLTATMRADGSSKFGANNKWAYFPSGAVSWKLHNESFMKDVKEINELKLRASFGISGNQGISPYQTLSRYGVEKYYDDGKWNTAIGPGYIVGSYGDDGRFNLWGGIPNRDLKWETTKQWNVGADLAFLNRRLRATVDYYTKNTSDLLRERILPLSSGYDRMWVNDGEIKNQGFEFSVDGDIIKTKDFSFSASAMISKNKNEVVSLGNAISSGLNTDPNTGIKYEFGSTSLSQFRQAPNILAVGQAVNVFYGYKVSGIIQNEAEGLAAGLTGDLAQAGEFKYVDINNDGEITDADRTIIGDPNPDFLASLNLSFSYKNFDLDIFLNGVFGNDVVNQYRWNGSASTAPKRWTQDNPTNDYPSLRDGRSLYMSDWFIEDGSFVRIQNVNLGYNFNLNNKYLSKIRVYANASNLYTFSKFDGYDPEVGTDGIYWGGYPRLRKWTFGLDITF